MISENQNVLNDKVSFRSNCIYDTTITLLEWEKGEGKATTRWHEISQATSLPTTHRGRLDFTCKVRVATPLFLGFFYFHVRCPFNVRSPYVFFGVDHHDVILPAVLILTHFITGTPNNIFICFFIYVTWTTSDRKLPCDLCCGCLWRFQPSEHLKSIFYKFCLTKRRRLGFWYKIVKVVYVLADL